ncbi:MAG: hypothetical protein AAFQ42_14025 [Pseudomonadota bacterium]
MLEVAAMTAAIAASENPQKILDDLDDEELHDLKEDTENRQVWKLVDDELARRKARPRGRIISGGTLFVIVTLLLAIGSIVAVAYR